MSLEFFYPSIASNELNFFSPHSQRSFSESNLFHSIIIIIIIIIIFWPLLLFSIYSLQVSHFLHLFMYSFFNILQYFAFFFHSTTLVTHSYYFSLFFPLLPFLSHSFLFLLPSSFLLSNALRVVYL